MRRAVAMVAALALLAACGDDGSDEAGTDGKSAADRALAELVVISTDVTVDAGDAEASSSESGDPLEVGDTVRTDPEGFAEIGFFDGSLTRVDHDAEFTLVELSDAEDAEVVSTDLVAGRSWNRIEKLSESETWSQDTPVAAATVRGTAYLADCAAVVDSCTFAVFEGTVEFVLADGTTITLEAGQQITITADEPPPVEPEAISDAIAEDPWVQENQTLDEESGPTSSDDGAATTTETNGSDLSGTWVGEQIMPDELGLVSPTLPFFVSMTCSSSDCAVKAVFVFDNLSPFEFEVEGTRSGDVVTWVISREPCPGLNTYSVTVSGDALTGEADVAMASPTCEALAGGTATIEATASTTTLDEFVEAHGGG